MTLFHDLIFFEMLKALRSTVKQCFKQEKKGFSSEVDENTSSSIQPTCCPSKTVQEETPPVLTHNPPTLSGLCFLSKNVKSINAS